METTKELKSYLENYPVTTSNQMDRVFDHLSKSDESGIAMNYRRGEVFLYTKAEYEESLDEVEVYDPEMAETLRDAAPSVYTLVVSEMGGNDYFII